MKDVCKCSKYVIGYIDLLGTTERIKNDVKSKNLNEMYNAIKFAVGIEELNKHAKKMKLESYIKDIKVKAFSDNVIFAIPVGNKVKTLFAMCNIISAFQNILISRYKWLSRGGITIGDLFINDNFVWGEGLLRAYYLESKVALYPRVIIDRSIIYEVENITDMYDRMTVSNLKVLQDFDNYYFVDYSPLDCEEAYNTLFADLLNDLYEELISENETSHDERIFQKLVWLKKYSEYLKKKFYTEIGYSDDEYDEES